VYIRCSLKWRARGDRPRGILWVGDDCVNRYGDAGSLSTLGGQDVEIALGPCEGLWKDAHEWRLVSVKKASVGWLHPYIGLDIYVGVSRVYPRSPRVPYVVYDGGTRSLHGIDIPPI